MAELTETKLRVRSVSPNFHFVGDRDYVNAATILGAILDNLQAAGLPGAVSNVRLNLRRVGRHHLTLFYGEPGAPSHRPAEALADFMVASGDGQIFGWTVETDRTIDERTPYDATIMDRLGVIQGNRIDISGRADFTTLQVALTSARRLHDSLFPPQSDEMWLPSRIEIPRPLAPDDATGLRIEMVRNLGTRMTQSNLRRGGEDLGTVSFSLART